METPQRRKTDREEDDFRPERHTNGSAQRILMIVGFAALPLVSAGLVVFYGYDRMNTQAKISEIDKKAEEARTQAIAVTQAQAVQSASWAVQYAAISSALSRIEKDVSEVRQQVQNTRR